MHLFNNKFIYKWQTSRMTHFTQNISHEAFIYREGCYTGGSTENTHRAFTTHKNRDRHKHTQKGKKENEFSFRLTLT